MTAVIWVVEMFDGKIWKPTVGVDLTRETIRGRLKAWQSFNPHDKFRIQRYKRIGNGK